jgi:hypothetical protein
MKTKITISLFIISLTLTISAQSDSIIQLNRKIIFYENGTPKQLITYNKDSCDYFDDFGLIEFNENCRDGVYKEWYSNGQLLLSGQYTYELGLDTIIIPNPNTGLLDTLYHSDFYSNKTGIWDKYDSLGNKIVTERYIKDRLIVEQTPYHDTSFTITSDSVWIKLQDYSEFSSYLINRDKVNKVLILQFPSHATHNYWKICDKKVDLLTDDYPIGHIFNWDKAIADLTADDSCWKKCRNYYDFSKLQEGRYFIYYWSFIGVFHEIEIILNDV